MKILYEEKEYEVNERIRISELLENEIRENPHPVVGAKFNNEYQNLDFEIEEDGQVELIDISQKEGMKIYRRTLVYIMGKAFEALYPKAKVKVNYQLDNSMYCTSDDVEMTDEFINDIKLRMAQIIDSNQKIDKIELSREEAEKFYERNHTSKGRLQVDLQSNKVIYMYKCGEYCNYFYGEVATYTGIAKIFDIQNTVEDF